MNRLAKHSLTAIAAGLAAVPGAGAAQEEGQMGATEQVTYEINPYAATVPFGPGEYLEYEVDTGFIGGGSGYMRVESLEDVRGVSTYKLDWYIKGSVLFGAAKLNQHNYSWLDVENLTSLRHIREDVEEDEDKENRRKHYEIYPEEYRWEVVGTDDEGDLASALPLDYVSFIYFLRQMELEVGKEYTLNRYFKEDGNPVRIRVLRKDVRETDAGTFNTIVVQPIIPGERLFDEGANAELHFSDDEHRRIVYMKSALGVLGINLELKLRSIVSNGQYIHGNAEDTDGPDDDAQGSAGSGGGGF